MTAKNEDMVPNTAMPQYKRPPITEAVINLRFAERIGREQVDRLRRHFNEEYPFADEWVEFGVEVNVDARKAKLDEANAGLRLASADRADVLLLTYGHLTCSRLAPYVGWEVFRARAAKIWQTAKRDLGYRKVQRVGVRYINRIDIPAAVGEKIRVEDYLKVRPEAEAIPAMAHYVIQVGGPLGEDDCNLIINSRTVPSPMVNHMSVVFDIDIFRDSNVPQRDEDIWVLIDKIRSHKNRVFEQSVTDKARGLFNA